MKIERVDQLYQYLRVENILPQPFDAGQRRRFEEAIESFVEAKVKSVPANSCVISRFTDADAKEVVAAWESLQGNKRHTSKDVENEADDR